MTPNAPFYVFWRLQNATTFVIQTIEQQTSGHDDKCLESANNAIIEIEAALRVARDMRHTIENPEENTTC